MDIDLVKLNLNPNSIILLKFIISFIMFGVALEIKIEDFKNLLRKPQNIFIAFSYHYILFPFLTYLLILFFQIKVSIALGLMMIAVCPAGNLANLFTSMAHGNIAISVGITSLTTMLSLFFMSTLLLFLGSKIPGSENILTTIHLNPQEMFEGVFLLLALPLALGILFSRYFSMTAQKIKKIMKTMSFLFLIFFIVGALSANYKYFVQYFDLIIGITLLHNLLAFGGSYLWAKAWKSNFYDSKAIVMGSGIKNTALGLALVFQFFQGLGGMAMIVAWWGVSQIITGLALTQILNRIKK